DGSGRIQIFLKKDLIDENLYFLFVENIELGDFVQVKGKMFLTRAGEETLEVHDWKILSKAILPLPEKWKGLKDVEERYRHRALDLLMNSDVRDKFIFRNKMISRLRKFLEENRFQEVETPILQTIPSGAAAKPFKTYLNALNMELYLRIAPELYLKRLLVGGFERIFEIGKCFRNEGIDYAHNPEFTMMELYIAYWDWKKLMEFTEKIFEHLVPKLELEYDGKKIDLTPPWPRITLRDLILTKIGIDIDKATDNELKERIKKEKIIIDQATISRTKMIDELYKKVCRPKLIQPTFITTYPLEMSPLAKQLEGDSKNVARFQLVLAGFELVNGYSELNDPLEQERRFKEQSQQLAKGDEEVIREDDGFVEDISYGMPPAAGLGIGIDRLAAILTDSHSIREIMLFPLMRPKKEEE
ncbi:MAG TPA: lysine--tRNA ligase, partial [Candidatus Portnoybacteria bacterium]|nr:lysine--tRNA ligase [Candidatus Portnoybacteria bacterium]